MNTLENNKLIAEFMGYESYEYRGYRMFILEEDNHRTDVDLHYHTSRDWLMPVVEEIHTHGCVVVISSNGVTTIYSSKGEVLAEEDSEEDDHMHDATYKAVVTYIKEHFNKI